MSRNRILLLEVEKTVRDANAAIQAYDSRWQDLRELNVAVSAAEADVQAATDTAKPAVKGKKNAGKPKSRMYPTQRKEVSFFIIMSNVINIRSVVTSACWTNTGIPRSQTCER